MRSYLARSMVQFFLWVGRSCCTDVMHVVFIEIDIQGNCEHG